ncbi:hypothetical protein N7530_003033 [Penicillium desertorum]|uniref:Uncharacterized protein n=1 Tax=Penicillium desertorum TaxID=1303715 RepID=A0A9X0BTN3_9EURO|nr:hypothetical protein N7530_003033 [Penicillium desertorum]
MASSSAPSLANLAFEEICRRLEAFVNGKKASASFVCGGLVPIDANTASSIPSQTTMSPPVRVWWQTDGDNILRKLTLPIDSQAGSKTESGLRQLVIDCEPASFGKGQQDVLDPKYRKAGKLEPRSFLTSFHPSDFGILQNVEQILLPNFNTDLENRLPFQKMHAELYTRVHLVFSGSMLTHHDPRARSAHWSFAYLLISKGVTCSFNMRESRSSLTGVTKVLLRSDGQRFTVTASTRSKKFTAGDRITLTYNLYVTEPVGGSIPPSLIVDPKSMSLYSFLQELLVEPGFMEDGGALGFFCSHAYPHASDEAPMLLPRALKGSDLVLYSVFKSLGIQIDALPVVLDSYYDPSEEKHVRVGDRLRPYHASYMIEEDESVAEQEWPGEYRPEITWIGSPTHEEMALGYIAYGNEPSLGAVYSYAALIADIPPFLERQGLVLA